MTKEREFKVDITLAAEVAQFLETLLVAEFNEEFDAEEPCTDTFLDQFITDHWRFTLRFHQHITVN